MYLIGKVLKTHGVKGEVKVDNYSDFNRFVVNKAVVINNKEYVIKSVRPQNDLLLVSFVGLNNLDEVLPLHSGLIYTKEPIDANELDEDEHYLPDLVNLPVHDQNNDLIGKVSGFMEIGDSQMMEIIKTDGKKALIPFIKEFVKEVKDDQIVVSLIEGLI